MAEHVAPAAALEAEGRRRLHDVGRQPDIAECLLEVRHRGRERRYTHHYLRARARQGLGAPYQLVGTQRLVPKAERVEDQLCHALVPGFGRVQAVGANEIDIHIPVEVH
jgi:hypothetical protein